MKSINLLIFLVIILFTNCSVSLESIRYDARNENEGIVYSLPKNLIKVEIVYTIKEAYEKVNGIEKKVLGEAPKISIEKPITVSSKLVADESESFVLTGKRISNNFFTKSTLDFNLTENGLLKGIDAEVEDQSIEFGEKLILTAGNVFKTLVAPISKSTAQLNLELATTLGTLSELESTANSTTFQSLDGLVIDSVTTNIVAFKSQIEWIELKLNSRDYEDELVSEIKSLNAALVTELDKTKLAVISSKIKHLQLQIEWFQKRNKTYYKSFDIKYVLVIDPFELYNRSELYTRVVRNNYQHFIKPNHIFSRSGNPPNVPIVTLSLSGNNITSFASNPISTSQRSNSTAMIPDTIKGVVVRHPSNAKIDLEVNGELCGSKVIYLAQLGNVSIIPVKSKKAGKIKTVLAFNDVTGAVSKHEIEASSSSEKIGKSIEKSSEVLQETIDYLTFEKEIKKLQTLKTESTLENKIYDIQNMELERKIKELTNQEKVIALEKKLEELNKEAVEETDFEKIVKELEQQQKLLELELLIKNLKDQMETENGG